MALGDHVEDVAGAGAGGGVMSALLPRAAREADMLIGSEVPG